MVRQLIEAVLAIRSITMGLAIMVAIITGNGKLADFCGACEMKKKALVEIWGYAIGLSLLVGIPAAVISRSPLLLIPVALLGFAGGVIGTLISSAAHYGDRLSGSVFRRHLGDLD